MSGGTTGVLAGDYNPHIGTLIHVVMLPIFVHICPAHSLYATKT